MTNINNKTEVDKYFEYQDYYTKLHGNKTLVLMQIGDFYEAYCTDTLGYPLKTFSQDINLACTLKNKSKEPSYKNPYMSGFQTQYLKEYLRRFTNEDYTIVIFDQSYTNNPETGKRDRVKTGTYSRNGFFINDNSTEINNYIMSLYINELEQLKGHSLISVGITLMDNSTGKSIVHECFGKTFDENYALDDTIRIIQSYSPKEIIIYMKSQNRDQVSTYLNLKAYPHRFFDESSKIKITNKEMDKIVYQNEYLNTIYKNYKRVTLNKKLSILEILDLERKQNATISFIMMLEFIKYHSPNLLDNLPFPSVYIYNKYLLLENDAVNQLNVFDNNLEKYQTKFKSLFDVINQTNTQMGKRFLRESLISPLSQEEKTEIENRYKIIEHLINSNLLDTFNDILKNIKDIERYHRKMVLCKMTPVEILFLNDSYNLLTKLFKKIKKDEFLYKIIEKFEFIDCWFDFIQHFQSLFNFDKMNFNNMKDVQESFYKPNIHNMIDKLQKKVDLSLNLIDAVKEKLEEIIGEEISISFKKKDGYVAKLSKKKYDKLKIKKINVLEQDINLITKPFSSYYVLYIKTDIDENKINIIKEQLIALIVQHFKEDQNMLFTKYSTTLNNCVNFISYFDFLISGANVAIKYNYCKPNIIEQESSFIKCTKLRHPIIERINVENNYVPHDISLGNYENCPNGLLIYGLNSAGKSSLMKSVGLAIIMAQIGYYTPCSTFEYQPYMGVFARITGNDNIQKGLSSFVLEMSELKTFIKRTKSHGDKILVIGDEVCRGTEIYSAISTVVTALEILSERNASFIFTSHFHTIVEQPEIKKLNNGKLRICHIKVNVSNDKIIYDRILTDGVGPKVYGLIVAKHIINDDEFIERANVICKRLLGENLTETKSNFNNMLYMNKCEMCFYRPTNNTDKELETHHLYHQKDCNKKGMIEENNHIHKNHMSNLIVLCRRCHELIHQSKNIMVEKIVETNEGRLVKFTSKKTNINEKHNLKA